MARLVRTAIGSFRIEEAVSPETLTPETWTAHLLLLLRAVESLPRVELTPGELQQVRSGRTIPRRADGPEGGEVAAVDGAGRLAAILVPRGPGAWGPVRNLPLEEQMP
jgi:tRNA U55 pseudouridine synthase TruB